MNPICIFQIAVFIPHDFLHRIPTACPPTHLTVSPLDLFWKSPKLKFMSMAWIVVFGTCAHYTSIYDNKTAGVFWKKPSPCFTSFTIWDLLLHSYILWLSTKANNLPDLRHPRLEISRSGEQVYLCLMEKYPWFSHKIVQPRARFTLGKFSWYYVSLGTFYHPFTPSVVRKELPLVSDTRHSTRGNLL